ncbi:MAG: hypothetical protein U5J83_01830 [Bryobacterales bacterium]|nr:hypothetical protein [Bryobacterales bacterium]
MAVLLYEQAEKKSILILIPFLETIEMFNRTRAFSLTLLLMMTLALAPALFGQEAAVEDNSTRNQLIFGGAAVIIMIVYLKRRNKRKSGN